VKIVPKLELSNEQLSQIARRIRAPEHISDLGATRFWDTYTAGLFAVFENQSNAIIGLVEASGPKDAVVPAWWIDTRYRGKGLGTKLVDSLASYLQGQGYSGVGPISVQTEEGRYDAVSSRLAARFRGRMTRVTAANNSLQADVPDGPRPELKR
jgi:ribosomal protein S18 acetylase RimI-like enzyme